MIKKNLRRFVDLLKNHTSLEMDFAYSAERSIEDGIEEISQAEVPTVVVSYVVMFIYIAIALGKIRSFRYLMVCGNSNYLVLDHFNT